MGYYFTNLNTGNIMQKTELLYNSICLGDIQKAKTLMNNGISLSDDEKNDILLRATYNPHEPNNPVTGDREAIIKFLLEIDANVNYREESCVRSRYSKTFKEETPLTNAILSKRINIVKLLIENKANINIKINHSTPLCMAIEKNHFIIHEPKKKSKEIVKYLLDSGAEINLSNDNGDTPLMIALKNNALDIAELLIEHHADFTLCNNQGETALMRASEKHNDKIVKYLIEKGANIDIKDKKGQTALLKIFRPSGFGGNIQGNAKEDLIDTLKNLLEANTKIYTKDNNEETAFMLAAKYNLAIPMKMLIEKGIDIQKEDIDLQKLFVKSLFYNDDFDFSDYLLEKGVDIDYEDKNEETLLLVAIERKCGFEVIEYLIDKGADLNVKNNMGFTSLMLVIRYYDDEISLIEYLIEKGAEVDIESNEENITPLTLAIINKKENFYKKLKEKGAKTEPALKYLLKNDLYFEQKYFEEKLDDLLPKEMTESNSILLLKNWSYFDKRIDIDKIDKCIFILKKLKIEYKDEFLQLVRTSDGSNKKLETVKEELKNNLFATEIVTFEDVLRRFVDFPNLKRLSEILRKFSSDDKLRFTNHPWSSNLNYNIFMKNLKEGFQEIDNDLQLLSPSLYKDIHNSLFSEDEKNIGWSSSIIKKDIKDKNFNSQNIKVLQEKIKSLIVIKQNDKNLKLLKKFTKIRKELKQEGKFEIKINLDNLKENKIDKFFTDVQQLEQAFKLILSDINENAKEDTQNVVIEADVIDEENMIELKIIHINSTAPITADRLTETINKNGGNFKSIYDCLLSVCDWSIDTICSDGNRYKIDYLYPQIDNSKPHCTPIDKTPRGFTHILRFYI